MKLRKKKFNNPFFKERERGGGGGGGVEAQKTNIYGSCLKLGPWTVHRFKVGGGGLAK